METGRDARRFEATDEAADGLTPDEAARVWAVEGEATDPGAPRADGSPSADPSAADAGDETRGPGRRTLEDLGRRSWAIVGIGLVIALALFVLSRLAWLLAPAIVAAVLAIIAAPIVSRLTPRGRARTPATVLVFAVMLVVIGGAIWLIGPAFTRQVARLTIDVPEVVADLAERLDEFEARIADASPAAGRAVAQFQESLIERSEEFGANLASSIFGVVGSIVGFLAAFLIGGVVALMVVKDLPNLTLRMRTWMNRPENRRSRGAMTSMGRATTGFVRGQLIVAILVGVLKTLVLWLLGLPYFIPLGVLSGVGNLVPGVGPVLVGIPPVLVALARGGWGLAALTAASLVLVQLADMYWFSPALVGAKKRLPTLVIIVAMIIGAGLFGFAGLIIAVPVAAAARAGMHWVMLPEADVETELAELEGDVVYGPADAARRERKRGRRPRGRHVAAHEGIEAETGEF